MFVRELTDGSDVDQVLLVREVEVRRRRDGAEYLRLSVGDRSGTVAAVVWDGVADCQGNARVGVPARVVGRFGRHPRYGSQITVRSLEPPEEGSFCVEELLDASPRCAAQMEDDLRELIVTVRQPHLRALLDRVFDARSSLWSRFRESPAAKLYHQAYRHGLLEHTLTVAQAVSAISATFPGIDRDVAITGALLHDIGKVDAYADEPSCIELTHAGRLQGEIPLGYYRVRRLCEDIECFPAHLAEAVAHIVLSHHGTLEHGSPVVPCTREATLVHFVDNLGGRLGSFDRLEKELPDGASWSRFDRALGAGAYFGPREAASVEAPSAAAAA